MDVLCPWEAPSLLIFSSNIPTLLYYSHFVAILAALLFSFALLPKVGKSMPVRWFFLTIAFFTAWTVIDVLLWASNRPDIVLFYWNLQVLLEMLLYSSAFIFAYSFITGNDLKFLNKSLLVLLILPIVVLLPTPHILTGIDIAYCNALETEFLFYYVYAFEILLSLALLYVSFRGMRRAPTRRMEIAFFTMGIVFFLLAFSSGNIIGSITEDWVLAQVGLFGMPIFIAMLAYTAVRFKSFNLKLFGAQVLVVALWLLTLSLLFIRSIDNVRAIVALNLILFTGLGFVLIRSVRREIDQREHIEKLAKELEAANERQVGLIHFITHQIKGFVTKSRNIFASMKEGDCGSLPDAAKPLIEEGFSSDTKGLTMIQDILNAANIKSGKVAFDMKPFDLKALIEEIVASQKPSAEAKGLALNLSLGDSLMVTGDRAQLSNVYKNVIDNAIKYTPKGSVSVSLEKKDGKAVFKEEDTGVGISAEDMRRLFTEGGHGVQSTKVNTESTGFGLYIAKSIVDAHKGRIWAESDGEGKGSRFIIELPA
jgi:signal transduction histidine kinase